MIGNRRAFRALPVFYTTILLDLKGDKIIFVQLPLHEWNSSIPLGR